MTYINNDNYAEAVKSRTSWTKFVESKKTGELAGAMDKGNVELSAAIKQAAAEATPHGEALKGLLKPVHSARQGLDNVATLGKEGWAKKESATKEAFEAATKTYQEASTKLEGFISGKEKVGEVGASEALQTSYKTAGEAIGKVKGVMDGMFGMAKVEGTGAAAKHGFNQIIGKAEASVGKRAFKGGALVLAGVGIADSMRSTTKDGEKRGNGARIAELLASVGVGGAALVSGHAL